MLPCFLFIGLFPLISLILFKVVFVVICLLLVLLICLLLFLFFICLVLFGRKMEMRSSMEKMG